MAESSVLFHEVRGNGVNTVMRLFSIPLEL
jgi:hypothetical protein